LLLAATLGLSALGCQSGGVGDPCVPEDEYRQNFNGYQMTEVNVESKSFQCETRVCIVNHFQGRVSCPFGQTQDLIDMGATHQPPTDPSRCRVPGTDGKHCVDPNNPNTVVACPAGDDPNLTNIDAITVPVDSQRIYRNAQDTVYCSCRCDGPDKSAAYCTCPSGYQCSELVRELGLPGKAELAGSYCVKNGTVYDPQTTVPADTCYSDMVDPKHMPPYMTKTADGRYDLTEVCGATTKRSDGTVVGVNP
jgi:hypothetical protein